MNRILIKAGSSGGQDHMNCLRSSSKQSAFLLIPHLPILMQWPAQAGLSCRGVTAFGRLWTIPGFPGGVMEHHGRNFHLDPSSYGFGRQFPLTASTQWLAADGSVALPHAQNFPLVLFICPEEEEVPALSCRRETSALLCSKSPPESSRGCTDLMGRLLASLRVPTQCHPLKVSVTSLDTLLTKEVAPGPVLLPRDTRSFWLAVMASPTRPHGCSELQAPWPWADAVPAGEVEPASTKHPETGKVFPPAPGGSVRGMFQDAVESSACGSRYCPAPAAEKAMDLLPPSCAPGATWVSLGDPSRAVSAAPPPWITQGAVQELFHKRLSSENPRGTFLLLFLASPLWHSHSLKKSLRPGFFSWEAEKPQRKGKQFLSHLLLLCTTSNPWQHLKAAGKCQSVAMLRRVMRGT
ncbi:uncharacterized protein LOC121359741 [Pyrgilauda ruficollis]|uniref:uncharacterized protein LOC121359741 n=1 Tax=Pyrgilauda ruficollis TaxID=221976 RepID=UPI001B877978|nr:uncharacterized protein LOC121359741 [Pyrgilauda ruficollis]